MNETLRTTPEKPADKNDEIIPVVDEHDMLIGYKRRGDITHEDIYRVVSLWVINSDGQILLAQRHKNKSHDPNKWGPAASGNVTQEDESYEAAGAKEGEEEIGLDILADDVQTELMAKQFVLDSASKWRFVSQLILARVSAKDFSLKKFTFQPEEVQALTWVDLDELIRDAAENPDKYVPTMAESLELLVQHLQKGGA